MLVVAKSFATTRALPDYLESGSAPVIYIWSHFLRKTGVHFSGKCSKRDAGLASAIADRNCALVLRHRLPGCRPSRSKRSANGLSHHDPPAGDIERHARDPRRGVRQQEKRGGGDVL